MRTWTPAEKAFVQANHATMSDTEMADRLHRSAKSIQAYRVSAGITRRSPRLPWTEDDVSVLEELWGSRPLTGIANALHRSVPSVQNKASELGLRGQLLQGDMMSLEAVARMLGLANTGIVAGWVEHDGLKASRPAFRHQSARRVKSQRHYAIRMKHLLAWLEAHPDKWDSRRIPPYGLGVEYPWLVKKRAADAELPPLYRRWNDWETAYLRMAVSRHDRLEDIADILGRSVSSVENKAFHLGLPVQQRPK